MCLKFFPCVQSERIGKGQDKMELEDRTIMLDPTDIFWSSHDKSEPADAWMELSTPCLEACHEDATIPVNSFHPSQQWPYTRLLNVFAKKQRINKK